MRILTNKDPASPRAMGIFLLAVDLLPGLCILRFFYGAAEIPLSTRANRGKPIPKHHFWSEFGVQ